jgi:putative hemolysin
MDLEQIEVRLARTADELAQAQRLRYEVFYEECGAQPDQTMRGSRLDEDPYDAIMDHLLVIDHGRSLSQGQVVGNYRLLPQKRLGARDVFYSSAEFDLDPLLGSGLL